MMRDMPKIEVQVEERGLEQESRAENGSNEESFSNTTRSA